MHALLDTDVVFDLPCKRLYDEEGLLRLRVMHAFPDVELPHGSASAFVEFVYEKKGIRYSTDALKPAK